MLSFFRATSGVILTALLSHAAAPALLEIVPLGPQPPFASPAQMAVNPGTNRAYVLTSAAQSIAVVDTSANTFLRTLQPVIAAGQSLVAAAEVRNGVKGFAVNSTTDKVYVAYSGGGSGSVVLIDSTTDAIPQTVSVPVGIANIAVNPTTNKLYVMQTSSPASTQILVFKGEHTGANRRDRRDRNGSANCQSREQQNLCRGLQPRAWRRGDRRQP